MTLRQLCDRVVRASAAVAERAAQRHRLARAAHAGDPRVRADARRGRLRFDGSFESPVCRRGPIVVGARKRPCHHPVRSALRRWANASSIVRHGSLAAARGLPALGALTLREPANEADLP